MHRRKHISIRCKFWLVQIDFSEIRKSICSLINNLLKWQNYLQSVSLHMRMAFLNSKLNDLMAKSSSHVSLFTVRFVQRILYSICNNIVYLNHVTHFHFHPYQRQFQFIVRLSIYQRHTEFKWNHNERIQVPIIWIWSFL